MDKRKIELSEYSLLYILNLLKKTERENTSRGDHEIGSKILQELIEIGQVIDELETAIKNWR